MIELVNLCKTYKAKNRKKTHAVKNISLTLPDTGLIFIIGKSGSGKSTLLNLIGGLDDITSGDVVINGNNLSKFKVDDFANYRSTYVGFIFQDYHILDEFTVRENIELSADISNVDCNLEKCLKFVDLEGYEDRYPTELSGGQQQRVAIARALAKDSKIILADEPTGNLDNKTTKQILDILKEISKTRLVLIVSHNLDDASRYADRIISLDNGSIVSDVSRIDGYSNEFRIENNTLYLPNNKDLDNDNLRKIIEEKDNYDNIVQLDGGMKETEVLNTSIKVEKMNRSKLSKEKFKKLFNLIFKRSVLTKIATVLLISVLISLFSIFQSFNSFDENEKLLEYLVQTDENMFIARKNDYKGKTKSGVIKPVLDEDINAFKNSKYEGEIYKLYNHTVGSSSSLMMFTYNNQNLASFYALGSYGTLNCKEKFLTNLYGIDGKIDVLAGNLYENDYGVIITDYMADSILFYDSLSSNNEVKTYDDILGVYPKTKNSYSRYAYINAVINTNYKERYKDLISIYSNLWDDNPSNDNVLEEINNHEDNSKFKLEVMKYLGISYNFSPDYEKYLYSTTNIVVATMKEVVFTHNDISKKFTSFNFSQDSLIKTDLSDNNVIMTTQTYNKIFNTNYTKDNLDEFVPHEIKVTKQFIEEDYYEDTLFIQGLIYSNGDGLFASDEVFTNYLKHKYIPYALYFDSINHNKELCEIIVSNNYKILNDDASEINLINRIIDIFSTFLDILSVGFLLICVIYLMHFGYKSIKSNMYEIGIITALGCDNNNMGKLFVYEILSVGIGIIIGSFIGMYVAAVSSNYVLLESLKYVFNYKVNSIDIITFNIYYAIADLIIAIIIIIISALFPLLMIRKIKPVNILKAKE